MLSVQRKERYKIKSPEINLHEYSQLNFDKGTKEQKQNSICSTNGARKPGHAHSKINSEWIIRLNVKCNTIKLLEGK